jgi:hypothetical protein
MLRTSLRRTRKQSYLQGFESVLCQQALTFKSLNECNGEWLLKNSICLKTDPKGVTRNVSEIGENRL